MLSAGSWLVSVVEGIEGLYITKRLYNMCYSKLCTDLQVAGAGAAEEVVLRVDDWYIGLCWSATSPNHCRDDGRRHIRSVVAALMKNHLCAVVCATCS